jgi:hypothetical protein
VTPTQQANFIIAVNAFNSMATGGLSLRLRGYDG